MARKRTTVDTSTIATVANRMLAHLAEDGTKEACDKREAIIAVVGAILLDGNAYNGFRYLNLPPRESLDDPVAYDDTRIAFYG